MYLGQMVEEASVTDIFEHPLHPYTVGLIQSIPQMTTDSEQELFMIKGSLPLLTQIKKGLPFCVKMSVCDRQMQGRRTGIAENR